MYKTYIVSRLSAMNLSQTLRKQPSKEPQCCLQPAAKHVNQQVVMRAQVECMEDND